MLGVNPPQQPMDGAFLTPGRRGDGAHGPPFRQLHRHQTLRRRQPQGRGDDGGINTGGPVRLDQQDQHGDPLRAEVELVDAHGLDVRHQPWLPRRAGQQHGPTGRGPGGR